MYEISAIKNDLKIEYFLEENVCRLCWSRKGKIEITKENDSNIENVCYIGIIRDCLGIEISSGTAPKRICESCMRNLQKFTKFKKFCNETNKRLCKLFKAYKESHEDSIKTEIIEILPKQEVENYNIEYSPTPDLGEKDSIQAKHLGSSPSPPRIDDHTPTLSEENIPLNQLNTATKKKPKVTINKNKKSTFCTDCSLELNTLEKLNDHNFEIHRNLSVTYKCHGCDTVLCNRKERLKHERNCKSLENGFKCKDCSKSLRTRKAYEIHIRTHENGDVNLFSCKICTEKFKSKEQLRLHSGNHVKKKKYVCEHCGRVFSRPDYLHKHRMTHTGARAHACPHCPYRAAQRSSLSIHIRKHTGERPYACAACPQRCVSSSNLLAHARRHDPHAKGYQCKICDKKFGYKGSLDEHVSIAHELLARSFCCGACGSVYSRARGLRQHMKKKHGNVENNLKDQVNKSDANESEINKNHDQKVVKIDALTESRSDFDANFF